MKSFVRMIVPALIAVAAAAPAVHAQNADKSAVPQTQSQPADSTARVARRPTAETMQRLEDGRMAMIKGTLKMTDAQLKLWAPVEDLVRTRNAARLKAMQERMASQDKNAPRPSLADRLERGSAQMAKRAEETKAFAAVFRPFYESLSESQKAVAGPVLADLNGAHRMHGRRWADHHRGGTSQQ